MFISPTAPLPLFRIYVESIQTYFRNQHDILKTTVANVSNGQTDMSHKGELQTLTKLNMRQYYTIIYLYHQTVSMSFI